MKHVFNSPNLADVSLLKLGDLVRIHPWSFESNIIRKIVTSISTNFSQENSFWNETSVTFLVKFPTFISQSENNASIQEFSEEGTSCRLATKVDGSVNSQSYVIRPQMNGARFPNQVKNTVRSAVICQEFSCLSSRWRSFSLLWTVFSRFFRSFFYLRINGRVF